MTDPTHCGCCDNPVSGLNSCIDGVVQCASDDPLECERLFPLVAGNSWTYAVEELGTFAQCPSGTYTAETLGPTQLGGKPAFEVTKLCPGWDSAFYAIDGDQIESYLGVWFIAFAAPVEEGATWQVGDSIVTWHDEGSVTVQAGTFDHCWRANYDDADGERHTTFCRGVGPVRRFSTTDGNGYDMELASKNF